MTQKDDDQQNNANKPCSDCKCGRAQAGKDDVYKRLNAYRPPENLLKKHPCPDCFNCLWCGDARCEICLRSKVKTPPPEPDPPKDKT